MATQTEDVGSIALVSAGQYNQSIDSVLAMSTLMPGLTPPAGQGRATTKRGGIMQATISIDTQNARYTDDGSNPSATNGIFLAAPTILVVRTEERIKTLRFIGVVAGAKLNVTFAVDLMP